MPSGDGLRKRVADIWHEKKAGARHRAARRESRRGWLGDLAEEALSEATFPVVGRLVRRLWRGLISVPSTIDEADRLYQRGRALLASAELSVTVVSTLPDEDAPAFVMHIARDADRGGRRHVRSYYNILFALAHHNRIEPHTAVPIVRYMNLTDPHKVQEALFLLLYGAHVKVVHSEVPVEVLIVDGREVLLGFPLGRELFGGIQIPSATISDVMARWIHVHSRKDARSGRMTGPEPDPESDDGGDDGLFTSADPGEVAAFARSTAAFKVDAGSMIHAVEALAGDRPSRNCENAFDAFAEWYPALYDDRTCRKSYLALALLLRSRLPPPPPNERLRFLDCGCAHGLGCNTLAGEGFEYWGVDLSRQLLTHAKEKVKFPQAIRFEQGDVIDMLMYPPAAMPERFHVIACQGNTFDYFLGPVQKWFVLNLFARRLEPGGYLILTGSTFQRDRTTFHRRIQNRLGGLKDLRLDFEWRGDYAIVDVNWDGGNEGSVIMHPVDSDWLVDRLAALGFERRTDAEYEASPWFGPRDAEPYSVYIFEAPPEVS